MAKGQGSGGDDSLIVAGGVTAVVFTVCFFLFGVPMLIAGIVLINLYSEPDEFLGDTYLLNIGIGLVVVSLLCLVVGVGISIFLCVKGARSRNTTNSGQVLSYGQPGPYPVAQPGTYPTGQPGAYPGYYPQYPGADPGYAQSQVIPSSGQPYMDQKQPSVPYSKHSDPPPPY